MKKKKLLKYTNETNIIDSYFPVRLQYYQKRKDHMITTIEKELKLLSNKALYIQENLTGTIDLRNKKKEYIITMLKEKNYDIIEEDNEYKYLLKMPMDSVSEENASKLIQEKGNKQKDLELLKNTSIENMWLKELKELKKYLEIPKISVVNKVNKLKKIKIQNSH